MSVWPVHSYVLEATKSGLPEAEAAAAVDTANRLIRKGLAPVLSLKHLASLVEVPYLVLRRFIEEPHHSYSRFYLKKQRGGRRQIFEPAPLLRVAQSWILDHVLSRITPHPNAFAYSKGSRIVDCARLHCRADWLLKWDLSNFFSTISAARVFHVFRGAGYPPLLSFELSRLCTTPEAAVKQPVSVSRSQPYSVEQMGFLPQGAPTSPMLSNLAAYRLDTKLTKIAGKRFAYTRYADDIVFSARKNSIERNHIPTIKATVDSIIREEGFVPNDSKFAVSPPGARKVVLGLLVDQDAPRLTKKFKKKLERHAYFLRTRGPSAHAEANGYESLFTLRMHIQGLLAYAKQVEPEFTEKILEEIWTVDWPL